MRPKSDDSPTVAPAHVALVAWVAWLYGPGRH